MRAVKLGAVNQRARVMHGDAVIGGWPGAVAFFNHAILQARLRGLDILSLGVFSQKCFTGLPVTGRFLGLLGLHFFLTATHECFALRRASSWVMRVSSPA